MGGYRLSARILIVSVAVAASERIVDPLTKAGHVLASATTPSVARREMPKSDLVIVHAGAPNALADACRRLRAAAPAGMPIMAIATSHDIEERIRLVEAGADDVLTEPFDARQLELLTEALLSRTRPASGSEAAHSLAPSGDGRSGTPGQVICFAAAKGGAGTTLLAVNTAVGLARRGLAVALADLDFHHGQVATHLNLVTRRTTAELASSISGEDDGHVLSDVGVSHSSGVVAYPAPSRPDQASALGADEMIELLKKLRAAHPLTVVDAGSVPGSRALTLLGLADQAVIVISPDIPGLRALAGMLAAMADHGFTGDHNIFVINRTFAGQTIERGDIEQSLDISVSLDVPFDGDACLRAINEGQPVLTLGPRRPVSVALEKLCGLVTGEPPPAEPEAAPRRRFAGLLHRRPG